MSLEIKTDITHLTKQAAMTANDYAMDSIGTLRKLPDLTTATAIFISGFMIASALDLLGAILVDGTSKIRDAINDRESF